MALLLAILVLLAACANLASIFAVLLILAASWPPSCDWFQPLDRRASIGHQSIVLSIAGGLVGALIAGGAGSESQQI